MDRDVVLNKLESLRRCLRRIEDRRPVDVDALRADLDAQDILVLNLERAVQICVDVGLHILSGTESPVPETMAMAFEALHRIHVLDAITAERMAKAVGFRNTAVDAYQAIDWDIVFRIATRHLADFEDFARQVRIAAGLEDRR
jgi:uncharacterized protein YutE (UPF0331/DUF86 family)